MSLREKITRFPVRRGFYSRSYSASWSELQGWTDKSMASNVHQVENKVWGGADENPYLKVENLTTNREVSISQTDIAKRELKVAVWLSPHFSSHLPYPPLWPTVSPELFPSLEVDAVSLQCESHPDGSARTCPCHPSRMGCTPGASSWEHFWGMRYSWGLLTDDCETRFRLVSGTLQYTADKISSVGGQSAPKARPENTIKDDSVT